MIVVARVVAGVDRGYPVMLGVERRCLVLLGAGDPVLALDTGDKMHLDRTRR